VVRAALLLSVLAWALLPCAAPALEVRYGLAFLSHHSWRGITLTDDPVIQPELCIAHGNGLSFTLWGSADLGDDNDNQWQLNEIRLSLEYERQLGQVEAAFGLVEYLFPNTPFPGTRELYARVAWPGVIATRFTLFYDFDLIDGLYAELALVHQRALQGPWALEAEVAAGYADARFAVARRAALHDGRVALHLERAGRLHTWRLTGAWSDSLNRDVLFSQPVGLWAGVSIGWRL
jgi:hypothetical protein